MPWNKPWYGYYNRRRARRWGARRFVRRRLWRRRRRRRYRPRVRRKLPFLKLKQWQPKYINKLKVITTVPLYLTTKDRIDHNLRLFEDEILPHNVPGGGGFSITTFTLNSLYDLYLQGRAWWTHSNNELPLIRYTGCTMTLYRAESSDYIFKYYNCYPMYASLEGYNSTQPSFMKLSKNHRIIRCKKHNYSKKPYTKLHIKPPAQLLNKWYFQKDLANLPLVMTFATAMSLDRYYQASNSQSTTIGFTGLNTNIIKFHDFQQQTTHGYRPQDGLYLWSYQQAESPPPTLNNVKIKNLIFLGNAQNMQTGQTIADAVKAFPNLDYQQKINKYLSSWTYWGNLFLPGYLKGALPLIKTTQAPATVLAMYTDLEQTTKDYKTQVKKNPFEHFVDPLLQQYRYNGIGDSGPTNKVYLTSLHYQQPNWDEPTDDTETNNNLPLWLALWGFADWQKLNKKAVDTDRLVVLYSKHIHPPDRYVVPIDPDFLNGKSPYRDNTSAADKLYWHPKTSMQYQSINAICTGGPGTVKLPPNVSAEGHMTVKFYFKLGGCAQPIKQIDLPSDQPDFPLPNNELGPNSLQSPQTSIENFIYSFDWRRHFLTKAATQRISTDKELEMSSLTSTGFNSLNAPPPQQTTSTRETEDSQEKEETLQQLISHLRQLQQKYRHRILKLVEDLE